MASVTEDGKMLECRGKYYLFRCSQSALDGTSQFQVDNDPNAAKASQVLGFRRQMSGMAFNDQVNRLIRLLFAEEKTKG